MSNVVLKKLTDELEAVSLDRSLGNVERLFAEYLLDCIDEWQSEEDALMEAEFNRECEREAYINDDAVVAEMISNGGC